MAILLNTSKKKKYLNKYGRTDNYTSINKSLDGGRGDSNHVEMASTNIKITPCDDIIANCMSHFYESANHVKTIE